jgi:hypothetical protein
MEKIKVSLTMDADRLGADLLVATPFRIEDTREFLGIFQAMNVRLRVLFLVRGANSWLLQLRIWENDASRLSASRASEILHEVSRMLASESSIGQSSRAA